MDPGDGEVQGRLLVRRQVEVGQVVVLGTDDVPDLLGTVDGHRRHLDAAVAQACACPARRPGDAPRPPASGYPGTSDAISRSDLGRWSRSSTSTRSVSRSSLSTMGESVGGATRTPDDVAHGGYRRRRDPVAAREACRVAPRRGRRGDPLALHLHPLAWLAIAAVALAYALAVASPPARSAPGPLPTRRQLLVPGRRGWRRWSWPSPGPWPTSPRTGRSPPSSSNASCSPWRRHRCCCWPCPPRCWPCSPVRPRSTPVSTCSPVPWWRWRPSPSWRWAPSSPRPSPPRRPRRGGGPSPTWPCCSPGRCCGARSCATSRARTARPRSGWRRTCSSNRSSPRSPPSSTSSPVTRCTGRSATCASALGISPLVDQQLAGVVAKVATLPVLWSAAWMALMRAQRVDNAEGRRRRRRAPHLGRGRTPARARRARRTQGTHQRGAPAPCLGDAAPHRAALGRPGRSPGTHDDAPRGDDAESPEVDDPSHGARGGTGANGVAGPPDARARPAPTDRPRSPDG